MVEFIPLFMFAAACLILLLGYPVAFSLAGTALAFAAIGILTGDFPINDLKFIPNRIFGIMTNTKLMAVPLFILMGVILEKSKIAEDLLTSIARLFGPIPGGLAIAIILVGTLLAASTGIVGATVVTMGLMSLPTMIKRGYDIPIATGTICATGTLGQIIPPSIALVLLGDVLSTAYQQAQLKMGIFSDTQTISVGDLFIGAVIPGLILVFLYIAYIVLIAIIQPHRMPAIPQEDFIGENSKPLLHDILSSLVPPLTLIILVLGSILTGKATPTEAASVGAVGALILALLKKQLSLQALKDATRSTATITSMVFIILIGASIFSLVFRGFGGDHLVQELLHSIPYGAMGALFVVMLIVFLLGFILDFIEITFVVVPIVGPALLMMGFDPIWLGIMFAINLQTSFLTPPFGFALFYLRGVAPASVATRDIYKGVMPFIILQLIMLGLLVAWPSLATYLPSLVYS